MLRLKYLDQIRAIAIMPVVIQHYHSDWLVGGGVGIGIFFALSGYLITGILTTHRPSLKYEVGFLIHRIFRVYPLFILHMLAIFFCMPYVYPEKYTFFKDGLLGLLTMTGMPKENLGYSVDILWTLQIEFIFYILAPLILLFFSSINILKILVITLLFFGVAYGFISLDVNYPFLFWGGAIATGSLTSIFSQNIIIHLAGNQKAVAISLVVISLAGICVLFFLPPANLHLWQIEVFLASFFGSGLILAYVICPDLPVMWGLPFIGKISYSMYLIHGLLIDYGRSVFGLPVNNHPIFAFIFLVFFSTVTFVFIEKPGIAAGRWLTSPRRLR